MFRAHHGLGVSALLLWSLAGPSLHAQSSAVPSPWSARDIGSPTPAGSTTFDQPSGTFTVDAGGSDIWGTSDKFHFVYQQVSGDVDVVARVDSITQADQWSKSGLMIRASLSANAAHAFALVSAAKGVAFQRRTAAGGHVGEHRRFVGEGALLGAPRARRARRSPRTVSSNGTSWTTLGSDTIALGTSAYVGIATTSHNASSTTTAEVSHVILSSSSDASARPSGLPSGQSDADVGSPAMKGSASFSSGTYTIRAGGADIWDTADQFNYVYQQVTGDVDVKARVASLTNTNVWAKAGVMVRASLSAGSTEASMLITPGQGYTFQRRPATRWPYDKHLRRGGCAPGMGSAEESGRAVHRVQVHGRSELDSRWIGQHHDGNHGLRRHRGHEPQCVVRDARHGHEFRGHRQRHHEPAADRDADRAGRRHELHRAGEHRARGLGQRSRGEAGEGRVLSGTTLLATDTTSPYSFTWSSVAAGTYSLTAVAYDTAGLKTTSNAATVTVGTATNKPPTVTLTAPSSGAKFTPPASISFAATASDPEGKLAKVEFYSGTKLLGTDTTSPYSYTWPPVAAGSYSLTAVAYDTAGAKTTSAAVPVTVSSPPHRRRAMWSSRNPPTTPRWSRRTS